MKKILALLLVLFVGFATTVSAETLWFRAYNVAVKIVNDYNRNSSAGWSDYEDCNILIQFDLDYSRVTIHSNETQVYDIYDVTEEYTDSEGGSQYGFYFVDQDDDEGLLRLRVTPDGDYQIYIDFDDIAWMYNVVPKD